MSKSPSHDFIDTMEQWFAKFPALPKNATETLVKITPVLALIFGILGILAAIGGLGILTATSPLSVLGGRESMSAYGTGFIASIFYLAASALLLAAYPGVKAHKVQGWKLLFWSETVSLVGGVVGMTSIVSALIGALIGFYILFQIKSYYK